jgi:hypothetical protein
MKKPRLNLCEVEVLLKMHRAESIDKSLHPDRLVLAAKGLVCYSGGWKLTHNGKQIARHLSGKI